MPKKLQEEATSNVAEVTQDETSVSQTVDTSELGITPAELEKLTSYQPPPNDQLTKEEAKAVLEKYSRFYNLTKAEALHSVTYWTQNGGYVKSVPDTKTHDINHKGAESLKQLRACVEDVRPGGTVRQLARTLAPYLLQVALQKGYKGHLWKSLKQNNDPSLEGPDLYYCCEFYANLPGTPTKVVEALAARSKERSQRKQAPKPKKRKGGKK